MKHRDISKVKVGDLWVVKDYDDLDVFHTFVEVSEDEVTYCRGDDGEFITWTKKMAKKLMNFNNGSSWNLSYFVSPEEVK